MENDYNSGVNHHASFHQPVSGIASIAQQFDASFVPPGLTSNGYGALTSGANLLPKEASPLGGTMPSQVHPQHSPFSAPLAGPPNVSLLVPGPGVAAPSFTSSVHQKPGMSGQLSPHTPTTNYYTNQGIEKGVIYALSQYSPFISMSSTQTSAKTTLANEAENNNLGPEDVAEVRQMTQAAAASSLHENMPKLKPGKCQNGGELRLSELTEKLDGYHLPEGFCLVGAKSPMLSGMMLVAAVDKRYLPGGANTVTMLGFTGNCVGCGASGFRYFTEFTTHINLKLATQPKKQKHLKYYIVRNDDGKWARGPLIPWKGTEQRKRSVPTFGMPLFVRTPEVVPSKVASARDRFVNEEPGAKKHKSESEIEEKIETESSVASPSQTDSEDTLSTANEEPTDLPPVKPLPENDTLVEHKLPMSAICGVRPVLLLCQRNKRKLPSSVTDIIISDLLVGCFDFPDTSKPEKTKTTYQYYSNSLMSTGFSNSQGTNSLKESQLFSNVEQNAANMLINMSSNHVLPSSSTHLPLRGNEWGKNTIKKNETHATLPLQGAIILVTQYLCSLDDTSINKEQIEFMLNKSKRELNASNIACLPFAETSHISNAHLSFIVNLICSSSNGKVKTISSTVSLQNAINKTLQWIHDTFYISSVSNKRLLIPNYIVILHNPLKGPVEFAILVTGISHAKILAECLGISSLVQCPFQDDLARLRKQFQQTTDALSYLSRMFQEARDNMVYVPFNGYAGMRLTHAQAQEWKPSVAPIAVRPPHTKGVFANQAAMANQLLSQLRNIGENPDILDLESFHELEILIVVPPTVPLYYLTVKRLCESGLLNYLGLEPEESLYEQELAEKYVITYSDWTESVNKWTSFVKKVQHSKETLFLLVFDQAQRYSLPQGMPDVLPNLKEVFQSTNVIPVFVTSLPYIFQTRKSFIDPDNEVYWTDTRQAPSTSKFGDEKCVMINDKDMIYFGMKDYCESTQWNEQYALLRHEETFDITIPNANSLNNINYSMVQGFALVRLYRAALMVSGGIRTAESYAVMSVIRMVNDVVESPLRNADGSGCMLMIRIPDKQLGKYCYEILMETRNSIGFQYRFDILYDDGDNELQIGDYFLERMRLWRIKKGWKEEAAKTWYPKCLEELLDLPCILVLSGDERSGETFPRSLKYIDLNIINHSSFHRSSIEAEIGAFSCYLSVNAHATHSTISDKPVVMNNVRPGIGRTYLSPARLQKAEISGELMEEIRQTNLLQRDQKTDKCDACLSKDYRKMHRDTSAHFSSKYPLPILLVSKPLWCLLHTTSSSSIGLIHLNPDPNTRWVVSDRPLLNSLIPDRMSRYYRRWTDARPERKVLKEPVPPETTEHGSTSRSSSTSDLGSLLSSNKIADPEDPFAGSELSELEAEFGEVPLPAIELWNIGWSYVSGYEGNVYLSEQLYHEDKDNEETDKDQYHPRCLLLSGPPQVGKTGAYLHFARLLHRMLMRLKRVDVYDNCITYSPSTYFNLTQLNSISIENVLQTQFFDGFLDSRLNKFSRVCIEGIDNYTHNQIIDSTKEEGSESALVVLSKSPSYDTYHHCDVCRFYREGLGNSSRYEFQFTDVDEEIITLNFFIPQLQLKYFIVDRNEKQMKSLMLPEANQPGEAGHVKTPVFMYVTAGHEEGLLNLYHTLEDTEHLHITFVPHGLLKNYQKDWPNHVFVEVPEALNDASDSVIKNLIKNFASENYKNEKERLSCNNPMAGEPWPFVFLMPDNVVMWQVCGKENATDSDSDDEDHHSIQKKSFDITESVVAPHVRHETSSLFEFLQAIESNTDILEFALIGARPWSSYQEEGNLPTFIRTFVQTCLLINIPMCSDVSFSPHLFLADELNFQLVLLNKGLPFCRLEHFSFMCKITSRSSWRPVECLNNGQVPLQDCADFTQLVTQPDVEPVKAINCSSDFLMQKYLSLAGSSLFPVAIGEPNTPVLLIGGYINLSSKIKVCVINDSRNINEKVFATVLSGLVIYKNSLSLTKHLLAQLSFDRTAKIVLISKDRHELRSELARLDLEEHWRFRLRDEYQTISAKDKPLYFLTGTYCA